MRVHCNAVGRVANRVHVGHVKSEANLKSDFAQLDANNVELEALLGEHNSQGDSCREVIGFPKDDIDISS